MCGRGGHTEVDTVLDGGEDCEEDTDDEDSAVDWGDFEEIERHFVRGNQVTDCVDDDGAQSGLGDVVEGRSEAVDGQKNASTAKHAGEWGLDTALRLESSSRERSSGWVRVEESANQVGHADGNELLIWVDLVVVDPAERLSNGDVLQDENDGCHRKMGGKISSQACRRMEQLDILKTSVDRSDDTEWGLFRGWVVTDHQVGDECGEDDHDGCSDVLQIEVELVLRISPVESGCHVLPEIEDEERDQAECCVHLRPVQVLQRVDDHLVGGISGVDTLVEAHEA